VDTIHECTVWPKDLPPFGACRLPFGQVAVRQVLHDDAYIRTFTFVVHSHLLDEIRDDLPVDVYIYASHSPGPLRLEVSWHARYIGHVESIGGAHPQGMHFRPPSTAKYEDDNLGYWAVFWEVEQLRRLPLEKHIPTGEFHGLNKRQPYRRNFVPEGPTLVAHP
jgi:hypothetical protein